MSKKISQFFKFDAKNSKIEEALTTQDYRMILPPITKTKSGKSKNLKPQQKSENSSNECQFCGRKFTKNIGLKVHLGLMHSKDLQPSHFECDFDGKIFKTRGRLMNHLKSHQLKVKCDLCQIELSPFYLKYHIASVHKNERNYQCKICQKSFKLASTLNVHIETHNKKFECQICSQLFPTQGILNTHKKLHHENPGSFECEICGQKCNEKKNLAIHQKVHDKNRPKPFKCQRCDYSTDRKIIFDEHQKSHERRDLKEATIKCGKCWRFFKSAQSLKDHMRFSHPENQFQCDLCGKYINAKGNLKKHINVELKRRN